MMRDEHTIVSGLTRAERKSPPIYGPARQLFIRVLEGDFSYDKAIGQAKKLTDETERENAQTVLRASEKFLKEEPPAKITRLSDMTFQLPNKMSLPVSPVMIRHTEPRRLMLLHFWRTPLTAQQLSAIASILKSALLEQKAEYALDEIDLISVSIPKDSTKRRFDKYGWKKLGGMEDDELNKFLKKLCDGWSAYQKRGPRIVKKRKKPSLFD